METRDGCKVLYVTDNSDGWLLIERILGQERHDQVSMCRAELSQLRGAVDQGPYALILLDVPHIFPQDVMQFHQQLLRLPGLKEVPVLLLHVANPRALIPSAKNAGVAGYVHYVSQPSHLLEARDTILTGGQYYPPFD